MYIVLLACGYDSYSLILLDYKVIKRPLSVTIIAWFAIVIAVLSLISSILTHNNPLTQQLMAKSMVPISLQYGLLYGGLSLTLVAGIGMLKGQHWARLLYVGWSTIGLIIGLATTPIKIALLPGAVLLGLAAYFLFRPAANAYFSARLAANNA